MKQNKNNQNIWIIIAIAAIVVFVISGKQGWFQGQYSITNQETINQLESQITESTCTASISPNTITAGDVISGVVQDGANTFCEVYGKMEGTTDWKKIAEGTTSSSGTITFSEPFSVVGTFYFRVICGDCVTNQVTLVVNPAPSHSCSETDGGKNKMIPGTTTVDSLGYMDSCAGNWAVKEYYCNGNSLAEQVIACDAGYICISSRSGGYCSLIDSEPEYTCTDSDGGNFPNVMGDCEDSYHMAGFMDTCGSLRLLTEWYCDEDNICQSTIVTCPVGWFCIGGQCAQPACSGIINPISQSSCDPGYCSSGSCIFVPATLVSPARCTC